MRWLFAIAIVAATVTVAWANLPRDWIIIGGGVSSASGGNPAVGCTNQLVLDYSNSCALIGQAFGE